VDSPTDIGDNKQCSIGAGVRKDKVNLQERMVILHNCVDPDTRYSSSTQAVATYQPCEASIVVLMCYHTDITNTLTSKKIYNIQLYRFTVMPNITY